MTPRSTARTTGAIVAALVAAAALGYWGYGAYKRYELRSGAAALLKDAGGRLREALTVEAGPAPADRLQAAKKLDEHAAATDKLIEQLKRLDVARDRAFTDDADNHLIATREIFRKRAASHRYYLLHSESLQALQEHLRGDRRAKTWARDAVRAKERAEKDFRDYRLAVAAYGTLLGSFPASQKKIAPYVGPGALVEDALLGKARERALETAKRVAEEMEKARQLLVR